MSKKEFHDPIENLEGLGLFVEKLHLDLVDYFEARSTIFKTIKEIIDGFSFGVNDSRITSKRIEEMLIDILKAYKDQAATEDDLKKADDLIGLLFYYTGKYDCRPYIFDLAEDAYPFHDLFLDYFFECEQIKFHFKNPRTYKGMGMERMGYSKLPIAQVLRNYFEKGAKCSLKDKWQKLESELFGR